MNLPLLWLFFFGGSSTPANTVTYVRLHADVWVAPCVLSHDVFRSELVVTLDSLRPAA